MNNFIVKSKTNRKRKEMEQLAALKLICLDAVAALQFSDEDHAYYNLIKNDYDLLLAEYCKRCLTTDCKIRKRHNGSQFYCKHCLDEMNIILQNTGFSHFTF